MTTAEVLQAIQQALATDIEFLTWCRATLGAMPTVQIDFDEEKELEADCYPFIGILAVAHDGAINSPQQSWSVTMLAAVRRAELTAATVSTDLGDDDVVLVRTRTHPGRLQAETLREQAIAALYRGKLGKVAINSDKLDHSYHPKFYSPFIATITQQRSPNHG
jgi:hypothetical protein